MIHAALVCFLSFGSVAPFAATDPAPITATLPADEKVLKALEAWLKAYRAGKVDIGNVTTDVAKGGVADKFGVLPKGILGVIHARRELELMLEQAQKLETPAAAEVLLTIAAIGLDHGSVKYKREMEPATVRTIGEQWLRKLTAPAALEHVAKIARGEAKTDKTWGAGVRAAAIRVLGARHDESARELCERQLAVPELPLRLAAAEALAALGDERSGAPLAGALQNERSDVVLGAIVDAMRVCFGPYLMRPSAANATPPVDTKPDSKTDGKPAPEPAADQDGAKPADLAKDAAVAPAAPKEPSPEALAGVRAAIAAIGRTNWRGDMKLLQFLHEFRTLEAAPALIGILQRFKEHPELVQSGVLSGLLLHRAHELLVTLTGAVFPATDPEQWAAFWKQEQEKLLADKRPEAPRAKVQQTISFCGLAVEGSRVLFIIDLSGSMEFTMRPRPGDTTADPNAPIGGTRLQFAKKQLVRAINELPENSRVNFITFNGNPDAKAWQKDVIEANKANKAKALEFVDKLSAKYPPNDRAGGTNLWSGLELGMKTKTLVYGDRDDQTIDEIFVVSDGAPSAGEITDPIEILRIVTETNRFARIRINTIFITSPNDRDPRNLSLNPSEFMRRMAEENGGRFVEFNN